MKKLLDLVTAKVAIAFLFSLFLVSCARAETAGTVAISTTSAAILTGSSATGRTVVPPQYMIGAGQHSFTYCVSPGTSSLELIAEQSPDGISSHYVPVSAVYSIPNSVNGNLCSTIIFGGYYQYLAINVLAISGGTVSVWYSATAAPIGLYPPAVNSAGATSPTVCDQSAQGTATASSAGTLLEGADAFSRRMALCGATVSFNGSTTAGTVSLAYSSASGSCTAPFHTIWEIEVTSGTPQTLNIPPGALQALPSGDAFCVITGAVTATTMVSFNFAFI